MQSRLLTEMDDRRQLKLWAILFVLFSAGMMILMPVGRVPDEYAHFRQSYVIADGQWLSSMKTHTTFFPEDIRLFRSKDISLQQFAALWKADFDGAKITSELYSNTAIYPPLGYLPQAIGIWLASLFTSNGLIIAYSGRFANWLFAFLILYWAIKTTPRYRHLLAFLTLLPLNLQEAVSLSADGSTTALVFAMTAFVLRKIQLEEPFSRQDYLTAAILTVALVGWKLLYFPMVLLMVLIPSCCFRSSKQKRIFLLSLIGGGILLLALWGGVCYFVVFRDASNGTYAGNTMASLSSMGANPFRFFRRMCVTILVNGKSYMTNIFADSLSWFSIYPNPLLVWSSQVLCILFFLMDEGISLNLRSRVLLLVPSILTVVILFFSLYIWWTSADNYLIQGIQGRYFLPILPALLATVKLPKSFGKKYIPLLYIATVTISIGFLYEIWKVTG